MRSCCCVCVCVCVCLRIPLIIARQRLGRNVTAVTNTHATIEGLLYASFSMWPVSYQGKYAISSSSQNFLFSLSFSFRFSLLSCFLLALLFFSFSCFLSLFIFLLLVSVRSSSFPSFFLSLYPHIFPCLSLAQPINKRYQLKL
jgi:hypothetical protein